MENSSNKAGYDHHNKEDKRPIDAFIRFNDID